MNFFDLKIAIDYLTLYTCIHIGLSATPYSLEDLAFVSNKVIKEIAVEIRERENDPEFN